MTLNCMVNVTFLHDVTLKAPVFPFAFFNSVCFHNNHWDIFLMIYLQKSKLLKGVVSFIPFPSFFIVILRNHFPFHLLFTIAFVSA